MTQKEQSGPKAEAAPPHPLVLGRPRWPATIAIMLISILYALLPENLTIGPSWILLAIMPILLMLINVAFRRKYHKLNRILGLVISTLGTIALITSVVLLVATLPSHGTSAPSLFRDAALLWVTNVILFGIWYWEVDGGGPAKRHSDHHETGDFLFPQMTSGGPGGTNWIPEFIDYLFLAFNTSTAFSPTDTAVLSRRAKVLMMIQSSISLVVLAILAARAINTL